MTGRGRPRLLLMVQLPPPVHGTTVMNDLVARSEHLRARFDVELLPFQFADSLDDVGKASLRKLGRAARVACDLAIRLWRDRPDAIYFTLAPVGVAFYRDCAFIAILKVAGVERIYHVHGKGIERAIQHRWKRALYRWAFSGARVIYLSPLLDRRGHDLPARAVAYVPNGVADHAASSDLARAQRDVPRVLYLSNMQREKGSIVLLEALAQLHRRGIAFEATFAGADAGDGAVKELELRAQRDGMQSCVRYVGPVHGVAKQRLFLEHDVFAFPSYYPLEAFPLVLLEAMQWGLPVVSTFEGAIPEVVREGETGFLVPQQDPSTLADRLERLLLDPRARSRMGEAGRARFEKYYTLAHFETSLAATLESWLVH